MLRDRLRICGGQRLVRHQSAPLHAAGNPAQYARLVQCPRFPNSPAERDCSSPANSGRPAGRKWGAHKYRLSLARIEPPTAQPQVRAAGRGPSLSTPPSPWVKLLPATEPRVPSPHTGCSSLAAPAAACSAQGASRSACKVQPPCLCHRQPQSRRRRGIEAPAGTWPHPSSCAGPALPRRQPACRRTTTSADGTCRRGSVRRPPWRRRFQGPPARRRPTSWTPAPPKSCGWVLLLRRWLLLLPGGRRWW